MANNLPLKSVLPIDGVGVDLASEIKDGSLLPGANIANLGINTARLADDAVTSAKVDATLIQYVAVPLSSAQLKSMYTAAIELIAGPGSGKSIVLHQALFRMTRTATAYTGGGAVSINYETGPVAATATIAASVVTTAGAAVTDTSRVAADAAIGAQDDALQITNADAVFADGTGTAVVHLWYSIV